MWDTLPQCAVVGVVESLNSVKDKMSITGVCRGWRDAAVRALLLSVEKELSGLKRVPYAEARIKSTLDKWPFSRESFKLHEYLYMQDTTLNANDGTLFRILVQFSFIPPGGLWPLQVKIFQDLKDFWSSGSDVVELLGISVTLPGCSDCFKCNLEWARSHDNTHIVGPQTEHGEYLTKLRSHMGLGSWAPARFWEFLLTIITCDPELAHACASDLRTISYVQYFDLCNLHKAHTENFFCIKNKTGYKWGPGYRDRVEEWLWNTQRDVPLPHPRDS
ncbi:hypothetical protein Pelo_4400 [Pelomyxa schiedti]|nr:hypothetical protein Pelo_4400 [Pelomyxa schiedti]